MSGDKHLFCFGLGFCAKALAHRLSAKGWTVSGTSRNEDGCREIEALGFKSWLFDGSQPLPDSAYDGISHIVASPPPREEGDPVLRSESARLARCAPQLEWVAYLSTTGVYGDRGGGWVDEASSLTPSTVRGQRRLDAENAWLDLWRAHGAPVHLFRLAGIYGPGRNQLRSVRTGKARRIVKPGQVFSRIHVEDVAGILEASIARPNPGAAYNVCDDHAAPPQDVVAYAADLLGVQPPPEIAFDDADLSDMARSFYAESKRVSNARIKDELGYALLYPDYHEGLKALL